MVNPIKRLATASQLFQALSHLVLVLFSQDHVPVLVDHVRHVDQRLPDLVHRLDTIADILRETLLVGQVLGRVLPSVEKCVLNVDRIVARVNFTPHEVHWDLVEDLWLVDEGPWVEVDLVMINFTVLV